MKEEEKLFYLKQIGTIQLSSQGTKAVITLRKEYQPALLHLEKFSHILLFYNWKDTLQETVVALERIQNDLCELEISWEEKEKQSDSEMILYDIKAYFPCEDNVTDSSCHEMSSREPITELCFVKENITFQEAFLLKEKREELRMVSPCGKIKVQDGKTYLVLQKEVPVDVGDYIRIIWWFHRFDRSIYRTHYTCNPPYENAPMTGVFASRSPVRPNPIAITTAQVISVEPSFHRIQITEVDAFDGTYVLGVLSYCSHIEAVEDVRVPDWLKHWPVCVRPRSSEKDEKINLSESALSVLKNKYRSKESMEEHGDQNPLPEEQNVWTREEDCIEVIGARENNLKQVSLRIPYHKMIAVTGVSGSGKTSLVFDTIYAESQRRLFSNLNLPEMDQVSRPKVDEIRGLPPAIAIAQTETANQPRSTVGTYTEIYDLLCNIFASIGVRHCPDCNRELIIRTKDEIREILDWLSSKTKVTIRPYGEKERRSYKAGSREKINELLDLGKGAIQAEADGMELLLQTKQFCYSCNHLLFEMTPSMFKYNQPESMCPHCKGLGVVAEVSLKRILADESLSLLDGASPWWKGLRKFVQQPNGNWMKGEIVALAAEMHVDLELPWNQLPEEFQKKALYGTGEKEIRWEVHTSNGRSGVINRPVTGAVNHIKRLYYENEATSAKTMAAEFMEYQTCSTCNGERLAREGRLVTVDGMRLPELSAYPMSRLLMWVQSAKRHLEWRDYERTRHFFDDLVQKLKDYEKAGLGYLSLNRPVPTLSGGEFNRLRFVAQLRNGLSNLLYIFDEPSKGLHPKDYVQLLEQIKQLRDDGNTILFVEHARKFIEESDELIEIGPGASRSGGEVVVQGITSQLLQGKGTKHSETLQYLRHEKVLLRKQMPITAQMVQEDLTHGKGICIQEIQYHNLKHLTVQIPEHRLTCVTGVSGSGKSSLFQVIVQAISGDRHKNEGIKRSDSEMSWDAVHIKPELALEYVNQKPIGKTSRSTPATYTGILDSLRILFASTQEAKKAGMTHQHFSYNTILGQCDRCKGTGESVSLFGGSSGFHLICPVCHGKRYQPDALKIRYHGKNMADLLEMSAEDVFEWAEECLTKETESNARKELKKISKTAECFQNMGLGYLLLGQSSNSISGGEAQRIKLLNHLKEQHSNTLFLLDEPTTGLHFSDVQKLLNVIDGLIQNGNTVVMIEHNTEVIRLADYVIDMGPGAGMMGGNITAHGSVEEVKKTPTSVTGRFLA